MCTHVVAHMQPVKLPNHEEENSENTKMTDWVVKKSDVSEEIAPEENLVEMRDEEIAIEADQPNPEMIERLARLAAGGMERPNDGQGDS